CLDIFSAEMSCLHLDEDSFFECCQHLLKKSEELRDGWSWETVQVRLRMQCKCTHVCKDDDADEGAVEINCPAAEGGSHLCFQFEFHVVFSSSYRTPVLYFRAFSLGKSLSLEDVWSFIQPKLRLTSQDALLNTITQQEHPLLGQAFFMLHPCKTQDFMRPVLQTAQQENRAVNYVLTWLSVVAPLVGLDVPLEYCSDLRPGSKPD
uniref:Ubiquitin-like-conjugating enzyme ATG10 n=1 Tax=Periophthalmus magnuspinnatus TaxID=409849 RepID=A0A3B4AGB5_9GOBI